MGFTWGSKTLDIERRTYRPGFASVTVNEIPLIPSPSGGISTIIQGGGQARRRCSMKGHASETDIYELEADKNAFEVRTFTDPDGVSYDAIITSIDSDWVYGVKPYEYTIQFLEV